MNTFFGTKEVYLQNDNRPLHFALIIAVAFELTVLLFIYFLSL